jgi:hypothetical protein
MEASSAYLKRLACDSNKRPPLDTVLHEGDAEFQEKSTVLSPFPLRGFKDLPFLE